MFHVKRFDCSMFFVGWTTGPAGACAPVFSSKGGFRRFSRARDTIETIARLAELGFPCELCIGPAFEQDDIEAVDLPPPTLPEVRRCTNCDDPIDPDRMESTCWVCTEF